MSTLSVGPLPGEFRAGSRFTYCLCGSSALRVPGNETRGFQPIFFTWQLRSGPSAFSHFPISTHGSSQLIWIGAG